MIKRDAQLKLQRIELCELRVFEYQERYPDRVTHYINVLKQGGDGDLGLIHVKPQRWGYEILDGHHRYTALILSGRADALCLVIDESHI